jgi:hypothetical protein
VKREESGKNIRFQPLTLLIKGSGFSIMQGEELAIYKGMK